MQTKEDLRIWAKNERRQLDMEALSDRLIVKISETEEYKTAKNIMIYYPLKNEINLLPLLDDCEKSFYLPKIHNRELLCCPYKIGDELLISDFKTKEPMTKPVDKSIPDLIFVPALACDINNYRLGYGKGFYDRFLQDSKAQTISCIPSQLLVTTVLPDLHDVPVQRVLTV